MSAAVELRPWSTEEDERLTVLWPSMAIRCLLYFPGRSREAVRKRAKRLRLRYIRAAKVDVRKSSRASPGQGRHPLSETFCRLPGGRVRSVFDLGLTL